MSNQLTFILVRLCECEGNNARRVGKHGSLTETGREQAQALHRTIERPIAVMAPSNSACRETAAILAGDAGFEEDPSFREPPYPDWNGLGFGEVAERWPREWQNYLNPVPGDADRVLAPGGETFRVSYERAKAGIDRAFARHGGSGGPVIVVTHGEITRLLTVGLLGAPLENLFLVRGQNGSTTRFSYDGSKAIFDTVNDTSHLGGLRSTDVVSLATGR